MFLLQDRPREITKNDKITELNFKQIKQSEYYTKSRVQTKLEISLNLMGPHNNKVLWTVAQFTFYETGIFQTYCQKGCPSCVAGCWG